jgi:hypothetical protein
MIVRYNAKLAIIFGLCNASGDNVVKEGKAIDKNTLEAEVADLWNRGQ